MRPMLRATGNAPSPWKWVKMDLFENALNLLKWGKFNFSLEMSHERETSPTTTLKRCRVKTKTFFKRCNDAFDLKG